MLEAFIVLAADASPGTLDAPALQRGTAEITWTTFGQ
jgi:hypothetical protein